MGASRLSIGILALLSAVIGVTGSVATGNVPSSIQPYTWLSWYFLLGFIVLFIILSVFQPRRGSLHFRPRRIRRTEEVIEEGFREQPATPQPPPTIPKPPVPYFAHRYPLQENFTGRVNERAMLTQWLVNDDRPVLALTAIGGMGKSALTWAWLQRDVLGLPLPSLAGEPTTRVPDVNRPDGVLWWSFYTTESGFSAFLDRAISYASSGEIDPPSISSGYEKALALVDLLQQHNILLVMDGFERELRAYASLMAVYRDEGVAESEGEDSRSCSDPAASTFLRGISAGALKGRILLTSRLFPQELETLTGQRRVEVTSMDSEDAVAFFHAQGVRGTRTEIQAACESYGYHPLALRLLAGVIANDHTDPGDIRVAERNPIAMELVGRDRQHHILQVSYDALDRRKKELLSRLSAFRSAVAYLTVESVFGGREHEGTGVAAVVRRILAANGIGRGPVDLGASLTELTDRGLLFREGTRFDIHPVVRRYAYERLTDKEGVHASLMGYFSAIQAPDDDDVRSVEDLGLVIELYHHTVGAGGYDEALELYRNRLSDLLYYRLGAYDTAILLLRSLFPDGENSPPKLNGLDGHAWTLNTLGISYTLTGQPRRAVFLGDRANHIREIIGSSNRNIAVGLANLAFNQRELGELEASERNLRRIIQECRELASNRESANMEAIGHSELGRFLVYKGDFDEAAQELETARVEFRKQGGRQGQQREGVVWAYRATRSLVLNQTAAALEASKQARQLADAMGVERDIVQAECLLGTVLATEATDEQEQILSKAETHLTEALTRSRRVNLVELEPDVLLAWAGWHRTKRNFQQARESAQEALAIADRSEYRLKQADIHNFLARLSLEEGDPETALTNAKAAHDYAWCDGPPHAYQSALDEADRLLAELGQGG